MGYANQGSVHRPAGADDPADGVNFDKFRYIGPAPVGDGLDKIVAHGKYRAVELTEDHWPFEGLIQACAGGGGLLVTRSGDIDRTDRATAEDGCLGPVGAAVVGQAVANVNGADPGSRPNDTIYAVPVVPG